MANSFNTDAEKETDVKQQEGTPPTPTPKSNDNYGLYVLLVAMIGIVIWLLNSAPETLKDSQPLPDSTETTIDSDIYTEIKDTINDQPLVVEDKDSINQQPLVVEEKGTCACVDLGLPSGTLWATCNIGANNPWENGNYFVWGEIMPRNEHSYETSKYVDKPKTLPPSRDAATQNWGGGWCIPTQQQIEELELQCTWTWTTLSDKNGYEITGENGNSIFLPAAGQEWTSLVDEGKYGNYWSSSYYDGSYAWGLYFDSDGHGAGGVYRAVGFPVRAVRRQ